MIKSRRIRWAGHVGRIEKGRTAFKILTGKPTRNRPLGRLKCRWEGNIIMYLKGIGVNMMNWGNWVDSAQDMNYWRALVDSALNFRVP